MEIRVFGLIFDIRSKRRNRFRRRISTICEVRVLIAYAQCKSCIKKNLIRTHRKLCRLHTDPTSLAFRQCYLSRNELISPDSAGVRRGNFFRLVDNRTFVFYKKKKKTKTPAQTTVCRTSAVGGGRARLIDFAVRTTKDDDGRTYASVEINTHILRDRRLNARELIPHFIVVRADSRGFASNGYY